MVKDNVNYGKLAYDQVLNFEKEKVIINQNTDFKLRFLTSLIPLTKSVYDPTKFSSFSLYAFLVFL